MDLLALGRSLWQNGTSGRRVSGASTIAMQVARMQKPGRRGHVRKATEALSGLFLVLAQYLRLVPYGNRIHGIGYALAAEARALAGWLSGHEHLLRFVAEACRPANRRRRRIRSTTTASSMGPLGSTR